jgi:hypothetical protein
MLAIADDAALKSRVVKPLVTLALLLAALLGFAAPAGAQQVMRGGFVTPKGAVDITGMPARPTMAGLDVSNYDNNNNFFHFPIHVYFGVTDKLALGPIHEIGPFFPWGGPCINCDRFYDDIGMGILYSLIREQNFELDFNGDAPLFLTFRGDVVLSVRGGVLGRLALGQVASMVFDPSLQIGITERPDPPDGRGNEDYLWLPIWFYFRATEKVAPFVGTGIGGRLEGWADNFAIPLEGGCLVGVTENIDLGGVFTLYNLMGHGGSADGRQIGFLGRFRFGGR